MVGQDPDSAGKVNQDACFHFITSGSRFICGGVLDGHGKKGHVLNHFLEVHLAQLLQCYLEKETHTTPDSIPNILVKSFEEAHYAARMNEAVPAGRSGTTCVVTIIDVINGLIYAGNVGDSRAIIAIDIANVDEDGGDAALVMALSTETTTAIEDERKRIQSGEGRIDGSGNVGYGPVGIASTRALGDSVMSRAGVIPTPQVTTFDLIQEVTKEGNRSSCDCRVLIGSDGIFDVLGNEEANELLCNIMKTSDRLSLEAGCNMLVQEARRKWQNELPVEVRIDDTTVVAIEFTVTI
jgi:serine/threonine protein phosphatase PrpC